MPLSNLTPNPNPNANPNANPKPKEFEIIDAMNKHKDWSKSTKTGSSPNKSAITHGKGLGSEGGCGRYHHKADCQCHLLKSTKSPDPTETKMGMKKKPPLKPSSSRGIMAPPGLTKSSASGSKIDPKIDQMSSLKAKVADLEASLGF